MKPAVLDRAAGFFCAGPGGEEGRRATHFATI